jgi:hypothetical protein
MEEKEAFACKERDGFKRYADSLKVELTQIEKSQAQYL